MSTKTMQPLYRNFVNEMDDYMKSKNGKMRMWGGLTRIKSDTEVRGDGVRSMYEQRLGRSYGNVQSWL